MALPKKKSKYIVNLQFHTDTNLQTAMHSDGNAVTSIIINKLALESSDHVAVLTNKRDYEAIDVTGLQYQCVAASEYIKQQPAVVQELTKQVTKLENQIKRLKAATKSKARPKKVVTKNETLSNVKKSSKKVTQLF